MGASKVTQKKIRYLTVGTPEHKRKNDFSVNAPFFYVKFRIFTLDRKSTRLNSSHV